MRVMTILALSLAVLAVSCMEEATTDSEGNLSTTRNVGSFGGKDIIRVRTLDDEYIYVLMNPDGTVASGASYEQMRGKITVRVPVIVIDGVEMPLDSARKVIEAIK